MFELFIIQPEYLTKEVRTEPHDEVVMMMEFIRTLLDQMRIYKSTMHDDIAFAIGQSLSI